MATYQGKNVVVTGDVKQGEAGYDQNTPKVKIKHADGKTETVNKDQVTNTQEGQGQGQA